MNKGFIMEDNELAEVLERLKKLPYNSQFDEVEQFSVKILENMAVKLYEEYLHNGIRSIGGCDLLDIILSERVTKIHRNFEWTNEGKEKLLIINDRIMQTFEKAYNEAVSVINELDNKMKNNDSFIKDYDVTIKLTFYMEDEYYEGSAGSIGFVLSEPLSGCSPIEYFLGHSDLRRDFQETPVYLDKTMNWNTEYFNNAFADKYICYAIHELLDADRWSFIDIINIKKIWADVEVKHQYFIENI